MIDNLLVKMEIRMTLIYVQWNDFPTDYLLDVYCPATPSRNRLPDTDGDYQHRRI